MKTMRTKDISSSPKSQNRCHETKALQNSLMCQCIPWVPEWSFSFDGDRRHTILCSNFADTLLHRSRWVTLRVSSRWDILDILCHGYRACDGWWRSFRQGSFVLYWILQLHNPSLSLFNRSSPDIAGYLRRVLKIELYFSCNIIFMTWNGLWGLWVQCVNMLTDILLD